MNLTITGAFDTQHPSFADDFEKLQFDANVLITEWTHRSYAGSRYFHIKFKRDFTPNRLARRLGVTACEAEIEAFEASLGALASFKITTLQREVLVDHRTIGGFPFSTRSHIGEQRLPRDTQEGQRIHEASFEDGDYSDVEITREDVPVEEVLAMIDKMLEENEK